MVVRRWQLLGAATLFALAGCSSASSHVSVAVVVVPPSTARPADRVNTAATVNAAAPSVQPNNPTAVPTPVLHVAFDDELVVDTNDGRRAGLVHVPALEVGASVPIVIALHGSGSTAEALRSVTGFDGLADAEGFIVAYPEGIGQSWNSGQCCWPAADSLIDDVDFLRQFISQALASYPVDPERVYITGHSNGAIMAQRVGCELSADIAAIVSVAGALDSSLRCNPELPVPMLEIHGSDDPNVSYGAGYHSTEVWRALDGCTGEQPRAADGNVVVQSWDACTDGAEVALITLLGGGHEWPTGAFDGAAAVWSFVQSKARLTA